jgi:hypothetical protein
MEEENQSRSPLLTEQPVPEQQQRPSFLAWFISFFRQSTTKEKKVSNAETVRLLMSVVTDLGMAMDYAETQAEKKKNLAVHVLAKGHKPQALKAWATAKQYEKRYATWFDMRENVEQIKSELVAQQQTMAVFSAFSLANNALERIAEKLNMSSLEEVLSSLHEKLQNGAELSAVLASPAELDGSYDEDTLAQEMAAFLEQPTTTTPKISAAATAKNFQKEGVLA